MKKILRSFYRRLSALRHNAPPPPIANEVDPTLFGLTKLPIGTVIDVGAYNGDTARFFRRIFPAAHLVAFEPQERPFRALQKWASRQQRVTCLPYALGERNDVISLTTFPDLPRFATRFAPQDSASNPLVPSITSIVTQAPMRTLDDALHELTVPDPFLLKIDVQGFELEVLAGAQATLRRTTAVLLEVSLGRFRGRIGIRETADALEAHDFHYAGNLRQHYDPVIGADFVDALFIAGGLHAA